MATTEPGRPTPARGGRGWKTWAAIGCGGLILLCIIVAAITAVAGGNLASNVASSISTPTPTVQTSDPVEKKSQVPASSGASVASPTAATKADPNRGIEFDEPITLGDSMAAVLVRNTTDQVKSFTVKVTYKEGDRILATAIGAVNDLQPGQLRAANLSSTQPLPEQFDSVRVDVDTMVREAQSTPAAEAARKITFGEPAIKEGSFPTVDVEVTNGDSAPHSFTVQAIFLQGGELVSVASGAVNDLAPGQTKTATLASVGGIPEHDEVQLAVDTLVK